MSITPTNRLRGIVRSIDYYGERAHVTLDGPGGERLTTVLMATTADRLDLRPGDEVEAAVNVAELSVDGRRAQSVVRTNAPATFEGRAEGQTSA